jgi:hypothetical protein
LSFLPMQYLFLAIATRNGRDFRRALLVNGL